jgi:transposase-like protein
MKTNAAPPNDKGYRFPPEVISHAVWLYLRFSLSYRDVEELMAQRGIVLTSETILQWRLKFGQPYANELRRHRPCCGDKWHLDEMVLTIGSQRHSGERSIRMETCLTSWCRADATRKLPNDFFANCSKACSLCHL